MKEITEGKERFEDRTDIAYLIGESPKRIVGGYPVELPREIASVILRRLRTYEVDDIADIERNYATLSKAVRLPKSYYRWLDETKMLALMSAVFSYKEGKTERMARLLKDMKEETRESTNEEREYDELTEVSASPSYVFGVLTYLDNISIRNLNIIKRESFELAEFDIVDRYKNGMPGVFPYRHVPKQHEDKRKQEELALVLGSGDADTFDMSFSALGMNYPVIRNGKTFRRGKKLLVHYISKSKGDRREEIIPSDADLVPVSVHQS